MANKYITQCLVSQITREIQIRTAIIYHFTPKIAIIKMLKQVLFEDVDKKEPVHIAGGDIKYK